MQDAPYLRLPDDPPSMARAFWLRTDDGRRLRAAVWQPKDAVATVLLFPGRTEYLERYEPTASWLAAQGFAVLGPDWRGQGLSERSLPDPRIGHVSDFADYQRDVAALLDAAVDLNLPRPWHLLAHSMGGAVGLAALEHGLPVASAVFSAPMWGIRLPFPVPLARAITSTAGRLGQQNRIIPGTGNGTYVLDYPFADNMLTSDAQTWARMVQESAAWPELTLGGPSFAWLGAALRECQRLAALPAPDLPALISLGGRERIVTHAAIRSRAAHWPGAKLFEEPMAQHEIMMETPTARDRFLNAALSLFRAAPLNQRGGADT
ncbi:MAG: alpha/beta hydrolase [Paracoccus sp. (in: a-proteobacteria)]|uniref:alpha/beta fold hydrolase n=1 Tax=Paracoccus sp. TaxID=267 RepID=UPI0026DF0DD6|nr:alpha/beta hydrolase [Paracoccus sp. (in: a-proteobacteria)]MDO5621601.1 alpha/beta hydrolase [Paracoccus sp. (in: a-proteobacteria)]